MARIALAVLILTMVATAVAAPRFPALTGRVVDSAQVLDQAAERRIGALLQAHEAASGNQIVVVTLSDLGGYAIEDYGYQLGRAWGIGQQGRDNGALLIMARDERELRIEVGYGLEGVLTDAISSDIIQAQILPEFRRGRFAAGLEAGVRAIITALGGEYEARGQSADAERRGAVPFWLVVLVFAVLGLANLRRVVRGGLGGTRRGHRSGGFYGGIGGGIGGFGGRGGGFGGGGFGGGGGSFGGGGASGGW